jgi:Notch-like protein
MEKNVHKLMYFFSSCLNGGTCIDGVNQYSCVCMAGFTGSNCQHHINPCDANPCLNGASCFNGVTSYTCLCPYGFIGPRCEVSSGDFKPNFD